LAHFPLSRSSLKNTFLHDGYINAIGIITNRQINGLVSLSLTAWHCERNLKVVKYENSVDTIVKDLIDNWQSPLVYLKGSRLPAEGAANRSRTGFSAAASEFRPRTVNKRITSTQQGIQKGGRG